MTHQHQTSIIRKEILQFYQDFKERHPFCRYQNAIGLAIFLLSLLLIGVVSWLWYIQMVPAWFAVLFNAFWMGVLHELEHDLIHWLYFKNQKWLHHLMLGVIWLMRPLTVNPWLRRTLHYHHHKYSGALHDVEERGVTNGERWSLKRLLTTPDIVVGGLMRLRKMLQDLKAEEGRGHLKAEQATKLRRAVVLGLMPFTIIAHVLMYAFVLHFLLQAGAGLLGYTYEMPAFVASQLYWLHPVWVLLILPNLLRQFCLHFITSNMHYFGDVEQGNVLEQTQVLNVWWTFPLQLFCFFFGWTHSIHHFVVNETFYVRHLNRKKAQEVLRRYGVRFNDLGTFRRANRFRAKQPD